MARSLYFLAFISTLLWISGVNAHGRLTVPSPRGKLQGVYDYLENAPVALSSSAFVCRDQPSVSADQYVTVSSGQYTDWTWTFTALHPGDCFAYISYDGDDSIPAQQKKFFKIAQWAECRNQTDVDLKLLIPSYLPPCDHCILRFEWYALHNRPNIEYYAQCADIKINGNPNGGLPSPMVYPGVTSLPTDGNSYRDPYNPGPFYFTGPAIATYNGNTGSSTQAPTSTTQTPTVTTQTPASTTKAPAVTTQAPTVTTTTPVSTTKTPTSTTKTPTSTTKAPTVTTTPTTGSCTVGHQMCATVGSFLTCVYTNAIGATAFGAKQSCPPTTVCSNRGDGYISCS